MSTVDTGTWRAKKEWYAWMGVREYRILAPVASNGPTHFEKGLLLAVGAGPLRAAGHVLGRGSAYSPILNCCPAPPASTPGISRRGATTA
ncbi:hypothetical protein F4X33_04225 [Candidatus Poribacteria bacterium]|nr:hypothetical protein [Candidatus Poribacteria bacterium]